MSDSLRDALEDVRAHLESGIAEAEAELADARVRCRELRRLTATARPVEGISAAAAPKPISAVATELITRAPKPIPAAAAPEPMAPGARAKPGLRRLPRRWVLALGAIGRLDLDRLPRLLARNVILRWEGENRIAGTHLGHAKALSFVRSLEPFLDPVSVQVENVHTDDANVEINAAVTFRAPEGASVRVDARLTVVARFDSAGMITLLFVTPDDPVAIDAFLEAAMTEDSQSA